MDNPKKKKHDRHFIALTQKHELAYIRKIARGVLKADITFKLVRYSGIKIRRLAKAFLKATRRKR